MADEIQKLVTNNPNARGLVVIVTNDYSDSSDKLLRKKPLPACHLDGEEMRETFEKPELKFALLQTKKNRPASEIKSLIAQVAKCYFPSSYKYFIFVYSGHGGDNCIVANDRGRVDIQHDIVDPLEPGNTSPTTGKIVKLFFFNSCRGGLEMEAPETLGPTGIKRGNYIIAYATMKEYVAYESKSGSKWMVPLAKQLREKKESSVQYILTNMIEQVRSSNFKYYQNPQFDTTCGHVYLYPDVGRCSYGVGASPADPPTATQTWTLPPTADSAPPSTKKPRLSSHESSEDGAPPSTKKPRLSSHDSSEDGAPPSTKKPRLSSHDSSEGTPIKATVDNILKKLLKIKYPDDEWNELAKALGVGGKIAGIRKNPTLYLTDGAKLEEVIRAFVFKNEEPKCWKMLVDAVFATGQELTAKELAADPEVNVPCPTD